MALPSRTEPLLCVLQVPADRRAAGLQHAVGPTPPGHHRRSSAAQVPGGRPQGHSGSTAAASSRRQCWCQPAAGSRAAANGGGNSSHHASARQPSRRGVQPWQHQQQCCCSRQAPVGQAQARKQRRGALGDPHHRDLSTALIHWQEAEHWRLGQGQQEGAGRLAQQRWALHSTGWRHQPAGRLGPAVTAGPGCRTGGLWRGGCSWQQQWRSSSGGGSSLVPRSGG